MKQFIKVMKALSDPSRVKILKTLEVKEMCVCEIQALLQLAQPTVSKHLRLLEHAGLVEKQKDKLWVNYRLTAADGSGYAGKLLAEMRGWLNEDQNIMALMAKVPGVDRTLLTCKTRLD